MSEPFSAKIKVQESTEQLYIKHISDDLYRIEETSMFNLDLGLGVVAKLRMLENQEYEVVEIVEKSKYISYDWMLSHAFTLSDEFKLLKNKIEEHGGTWEQIMGGVFIAHIPEQNNTKFLKDLERNNIQIRKKSFWSRFKGRLFGRRK